MSQVMYPAVQSALESRLLQRRARRRLFVSSSTHYCTLFHHLPAPAHSCRLQQGRADETAMLPAVLLPSLSPLMSAALSKPAYSVGMCRIWRVSRPCRVLAPPSSACILDTDSPVGLLANSCECSEPYRWVAAVTTCSCRAAHKAAPPAIITVPVVSSLAELRSCHHPNTY